FFTAWAWVASRPRARTVVTPSIRFMLSPPVEGLARAREERGDVLHVLLGQGLGLDLHGRVPAPARGVILQRRHDVLRMLPAQLGHVVGRVGIAVALHPVATQTGFGLSLPLDRIAGRVGRLHGHADGHAGKHEHLSDSHWPSLAMRAIYGTLHSAAAVPLLSCQSRRNGPGTHVPEIGAALPRWSPAGSSPAGRTARRLAFLKNLESLGRYLLEHRRFRD